MVEAVLLVQASQTLPLEPAAAERIALALQSAEQQTVRKPVELFAFQHLVVRRWIRWLSEPKFFRAIDRPYARLGMWVQDSMGLLSGRDTVD